MNVSDRCAAQPYGGGNVDERALHEYHIGGVDCHVGTRADCNTDVGAYECGSVVDAVADHGDLAVTSESAYDLFLAVG